MNLQGSPEEREQQKPPGSPHRKVAQILLGGSWVLVTPILGPLSTYLEDDGCFSVQLELGL